jgi:Peptidase family M28
MSDYDFPELPSDEELGITEEDGKDLPDDGPEMSDEEMRALLGEEPTPALPASEPSPAAGRQEATPAAKGQEAAPPEAPKPKPAPPPRTRWQGAVTLLFMLGLATAMSSRTGIPSPVPANAPDTAFSSARAMSLDVEIARTAHPTGSPEHARVRQFIIERLQALGLEPEVQTTTSLVQNASVARSATVRNVLARLPGTASTGAVLVTAHYDSREVARGAGDDGSGVVTILEAVRAVRARGPLKNDLIVLITDAEELGLLGARAFVADHPWMADIRIALSFEMRGAAGPSIMFETGESNGWVVRALRESDPVAYANSLSYEVYQRLPNDTDFTPFREAGTQGLNFAAVDNAHVYHQEYDAPENLSESTLQHDGLNATSMIESFGNADLAVVDAPNVVYFNVPFLGLVVYDASLVLPIAGGLLLLFVVTLLLALRTGTRGSMVLVGLLLALLGGALAYGAGWALLRWLPRFHPEMGHLSGSAFHREGWYVLALAGASLAIVAGIHATARRWLTTTEVALGAVLVPFVAALWLSYAMPLAAMNLQWPVVGALLAILLSTLLGRRAEGAAGWLVAVVCAVPVLVFMVPVVELVWISMTFRLAAVIAVLMAVTLHLCLPAVDRFRHPNGYSVPVAGIIAGGIALGIGIMVARPNAERPAPSTLVYAMDRDLGEALWATSPIRDSVDVPARAWAIGRTGSAFGQTRDLTGFGYRSGDIPVAPAEVVDAPAPVISILEDTLVDGTRQVKLAVRSEIGAEMLRFQYVPGSGTILRALDGRAIDAGADLVWADHWGVPDSTVVLDLDVPADEPIGLVVIEHTLRPEEWLGADAFARSPSFAPDITWMSDRAMFRTSLAADHTPDADTLEAPAAAETDTLSTAGGEDGR